MILPTAALFAVTALLYLLALRYFRIIGLLDFPERYDLQRTVRLPYPAGIIAVAVFLVSLPFLRTIDTKEVGMIAAVLLLAVICFLDDRSPLPSPLRMLAQVAVAVTLFLTGSQIYTITSPFGGILKLDSIILHIPGIGPAAVLSGVFTVCWLLLTINAMNWLDGVGGQVSVLSTIGFTMLGALALWRNNEPDIALLSFALAAIAGAGILFEFPRPRLLMGDSGSMFFGLLLGLLGIYHGGKVATAFLALGIPLVDALLVILERLQAGKSPFQGGHDHLHHLLLERRQWPRSRVVLLIAVLGCTFGGAALFLSTVGKGIALCILILVVLALRRYARS